MGVALNREACEILTMAGGELTQRKFAGTQMGGEYESYRLCGCMKGTSLFEHEQMGKQMRGTPGFHSSSAMQLGNDATSSLSAVCCQSCRRALSTGLLILFKL